MGIPPGPWYIDDLLSWTVNTHTVSTGAATDADSVPTYRIYEDETATAILTGSMALLDSSNTAGYYSEQVTLSAANGFEIGKSYSIYVAATVASVAATQSYNFKIIATPAAALTAADIRAAVGLASANLDTQLSTIDDFLDTEVAAILAAVDTEVAAIKTKTDFLPSATAGAAGGLFIAGTNAATTVTTSFTTTFTGNLTGSVASVTGAVGSVTGNVGGNVTGSVGTVNALAANVITAAATATDFTTEIQTGLATSAALTTVGTNVSSVLTAVDTEVAAIKVVTDKLDTALVLDGAVYQFTVNALELGPTGSGSTPASIADAVWDEVLSGHLTAGTTGAALNAATGGGGGGSAWDEATAGHVTAGTFGKLVADINAKTTNLPTDPADASDIAAAFGAIELAVDNVDEIATAVWAETTRTLTAIDEDDTTLDLNVTIQTALATQFGDLPTAIEIATEVYDQADSVETGLTLRQTMRLASSALFGEASGLGTTTAIYRDFNDSKNRIVATVDDDGNRISLFRDAT